MGAEVGVYEGHVSQALLTTFPRLRMVMVDPWKPFDGGDWTGSQSEEFFRQVKLAAMNRVSDMIERCLILEMESVDAARHISNKSLDFVFVDANHRYECAIADINAWWPKIRLGGLISGHDYNDARGVKQAVAEFSQSTGLPYEVGKDTVWWMWKPR
jgi:hypothetical protein